MTAQETAWQAAESAAAVLAPDAGVFGSVDAAGLGASTLAVMRRAAAKPTATASATMRFWTSMAGQRLSLSGVKNDTYVVGAINDHIVPWHGSYKTGALMGGDVRYVLSSGGHIAGIVNPPGPKAWYEAADDSGLDAEGWRAANSKHRGSWWEDWTEWSSARAGELIKPPHMGSRQHPAIADAPGEYVFG